jgi:predicted nucleotidyltransferase
MGPPKRFSGRFLLRLPPEVHATLHGAAKAAGLSLNEYCVRKLASPSPPLAEAEALAAVQAAARVGGEQLVGVVAFGSWARGEAGPESDIDLLVVVDDGLALNRELYRRWDGEPLAWNGHPVEPHFVHLPPAERRLLGVWAEAALDGLVLFERGLAVSRPLARVRREIARGRIQRREVHGQPYWVEAA